MADKKLKDHNRDEEKAKQQRREAVTSQGPQAQLEEQARPALKRAVTNPGRLMPADIPPLQRAVGNSAVQRLLKAEGVLGEGCSKGNVVSTEVDRSSSGRDVTGLIGRRIVEGKLGPVVQRFESETEAHQKVQQGLKLKPDEYKLLEWEGDMSGQCHGYSISGVTSGAPWIYGPLGLLEEWEKKNKPSVFVYTKKGELAHSVKKMDEKNIRHKPGEHYPVISMLKAVWEAHNSDYDPKCYELPGDEGALRQRGQVALAERSEEEAFEERQNAILYAIDALRKVKNDPYLFENEFQQVEASESESAFGPNLGKIGGRLEEWARRELGSTEVIDRFKHHWKT